MDSCMISLDVLKPISEQREHIEDYPVLDTIKVKNTKHKKISRSRSTKRSK